MTDTTVFPLDHLGILAIDGADAATFLQGQATCDLRQVTPTHGALGALCNLQGRMIVSFHVLATPEGLALLMPRDRVQPVLQHLKKYAVFSKVTLADAGDRWRVVGALQRDGETFAVQDAGGWPLMTLRGGRGIGLQDVAAAIAGMAGSLQDMGGEDAMRPIGARASANAWRAAAISAGECLVDSANADRFLPQALNYDLIDGVSFKKGCYTGQEVVARMHFKGRMKERLYVATSNAPATGSPAANTAVIDAGGKTVGEVVAAVVVDNRCLVAAVIRHEAVRSSDLHLADGGGPLRLVDPQPVFFDRGE